MNCPKEGKVVTAVVAQKHSRRANIFLEGEFAFSLSLAVVEEMGLVAGQRLAQAEIEKFKGTDSLERAREAALRYLSYRPRSEAELRRRLRGRGFEEGVVGEVILKLKSQALLDDRAFAGFWRENRETFNPRSRRLLELELKGKGVDAETVKGAISGVDDLASAYRAAQKRAPALKGLDYEPFCRKLGGFLKRRGFGYEVIGATLSRLWQENSGGAAQIREKG